MFGQPTGHTFEFECPTYTEAVNRLLYVAENGESFVMFSGPAGTGRSTLLRQVQSECARTGHSAILVNVAALDENAFLWHVCGALSIVPEKDQSRSQLLAAIRDEIGGRALCNHRTVLIFDDLDRAAEDLTSIVQFLIAINEQTNGGVTVIAGCDHGMPGPLLSLSALRVELAPLTDPEAAEFVSQLFRTLNADARRVTADGLQALIDFGNGLPVRLSRLCEIVNIALAADPALVLDAAVLRQLTGETLLSRAG